jgi:hypothetical protein
VDTALGIERFTIDGDDVIRRGVYRLDEAMSASNLPRKFARLDTIAARASLRACQMAADLIERTALGRALLEREMHLTSDGTLWVVWRNLVSATALADDGTTSAVDVEQVGSGRLRAAAYGDRLLVQSESGASADRLTLRWAREGANANTIERVGAHGLIDWISTGSARVGEWTVRRNGTSVEASRVQR